MSKRVLDFLESHYRAFFAVVDLATETGHPVPVDTRGWSQILVSILTGIKGLERKKGADLQDGSDVKGANTWGAIDTPRFNGVLKAGTKASYSDNISSLDTMPHLFFVLWDVKSTGEHRCRVWCVQTQIDQVFRAMCEEWYSMRARGEIKSTNFQLHPPRGKDTNVIRNNCGNLRYPLLFEAHRNTTGWNLVALDLNVMTSGFCEQI
jgi:hypothetical protein